MSIDIFSEEREHQRAIRDAKTMAAIRNLREHLKMNQAEFAGHLAKSIPTIQRYERVKPPGPRELMPILRMAREAKLASVIEVLSNAVAQEIPREYWDIVQEIALSRAAFDTAKGQSGVAALARKPEKLQIVEFNLDGLDKESVHILNAIAEMMREKADHLKFIRGRVEEWEFYRERAAKEAGGQKQLDTKKTGKRKAG